MSGRKRVPAGVAEERRQGRVQSVERALTLLEALAEDDDGHRLSELAARTGLSLSTVHRLLTTLEGRRFVQFDQAHGLWQVGRQAFTIGSTFVRHRNFVAPALPFLRRLRDQTHETANLGVVDEDEVVVLTQVESREIVRAISRVGGRAPIVASGMGKAILATYPDADVAALIERRGLRKLTPNTVTRPARLRQELRTIRAQGYAVDDEESFPGLRCVAAVVHDAQAEALCAISISGLSARMSSERIAPLGRLVSETARMLTDTLGGTTA